MREPARVQLGECNQSRYAAANEGVRQAEIAAIYKQFSSTLKSGSRLSDCGRRRCAGAPRAPAPATGREHFDFPVVGIDQAETQAQRRRLAGAVQAEQAEALAGVELEVYAGHNLVAGITFPQAGNAQMCRDSGMGQQASTQRRKGAKENDNR